jgi:polar amino acid transport system permease protein
MTIIQEYLGHIWAVLPFLGQGVLITVAATALAVFFGVIIGLFMSLCKLSSNRMLKLASLVYIDFIRGTPLLVQILLIYFGIPGLLAAIFGGNFGIDAFTAGVIACSLNSGAYVAEIFRGGIQSIERGQSEAARSLGMTQAQAMRHVILPQAFRRIIPPLGNEFIVLLKDSSLLSVIGVQELLLNGKLYAARTFAYFPTYLGIALVYLVMTVSISRLVAYSERKLHVGDHSN